MRTEKKTSAHRLSQPTFAAKLRRTWWERVRSVYARLLSGRTGQQRGICHLPLMCRLLRPKLSACKSTQG
jgi:hypothetical protein